MVDRHGRDRLRHDVLAGVDRAAGFAEPGGDVPLPAFFERGHLEPVAQLALPIERPAILPLGGARLLKSAPARVDQRYRRSGVPS